MRFWQLLACLLLGTFTAVGCGSSTPSDSTTSNSYNAYETCYSTQDICAEGLLFCAPTSLPVSSGYTGYFCTSGCTSDSSCLQVPQNYSAVCVNGQCYLSCPGGSATCPGDQGCFTFDTTSGGQLDLCTP